MGQRRIGVMQGRLSPRPPQALQAFPHAGWAEEFKAAGRLGFDFIEWIFEADRLHDNPLSHADGRARIRAVIEGTGVPVGSVCADYFMVHRLAGLPAGDIEKNIAALQALIGWASGIGARRILLPLLETSAVDTPALRQQVVQSLRQCATALDGADLVIGIETELPGVEYRALIDGVGHDRVRAYYDTGNSAAQGYDIAADVTPLLPVLEAVHIKDRALRGTSCALGAGAANFDGFFSALAHAGFSGDFVLQHYFDTDPEGAATKSLAFVRGKLAAAASEVVA